MVTNQLNVTFDGPGISKGVPISDLNKTLDNIQRAVRLMVEHLAGVETTPGRRKKMVNEQSELMLRGTSLGSLVAELELSDRRESFFGNDNDYGFKSLDAILDWNPDDERSLPDSVARVLQNIGKGLSPEIDSVTLGDRSGKRQVVISSSHSTRSEANGLMRGRDAVVRGYLMEVDWARGTARLDPRIGKPVRLRFDTDLHDEIRLLLSQFVKIQGKGNVNSGDEWTSIEIEAITSDRHWSSTFARDSLSDSRVYRSADGLLIDDPFESDDELQTFIRVIHEGRDE